VNKRRLLTVSAAGAATILIGVTSMSACGSDENDNAPATIVPGVSVGPSGGSETSLEVATTAAAPIEGGSVAPGQVPLESGPSTTP